MPTSLLTILRLRDGHFPPGRSTDPLILVEADPWTDLTRRAAAASGHPTLRLDQSPTYADALALVDGSPDACLLQDSAFAPYLGALTWLQAAAAPIAFADEDGFHKPAWNLDLALEHDLAGGLCLIGRGLLASRPDLPIEPSHDTVLRLAHLDPLDTPDGPIFIARVPRSAGAWTSPRRERPGRAAVQAALDALPPGRSSPAMLPSSLRQGAHRIAWRANPPAPLVSILVPTRDNPVLLRRCLDGILHRTAYAPFEIVVIDNGAVTPEGRRALEDAAADPRVRVLPCPGPFNYARLNNQAAAAARGDVLVLMNDDIEVIGPEWLAEMAGHALRPGVGVVGAKLLYPDGTVQHAGIVLGVGSFEGGPGIAGHFGLGAPGSSPGYAAQLVATRELSAVTAACLAVRRDVWRRLGGMDEENLAVALNDLDLCLRARAAGLRVVWTPFAVLTHHESVSRGSDLAGAARARFNAECRHIDGLWRSVLDADPFYSPNFSRFDHSFRPAAAASHHDKPLTAT